MTGDLVTDHKKIAQRYMTGWFAVDLLATFPVDYIVRAVEVSSHLANASGSQWPEPQQLDAEQLLLRQLYGASVTA